MFPPFSLVGKVINKIVSDEVPMAILVFPYWPSSYWFPLVLDCLCSLPIRMPRHKNLQVLPHNGKSHPLGKRLQMVAAIISGQIWRREGVHTELQDSSQSWSAGTRKQYRHAWEKWCIWNSNREDDPFHSSKIKVVNYLYKLVKLNKSYSVINSVNPLCCRHYPFFGNSWCKIPVLISRFMKNVFSCISLLDQDI